MTQTPLHQIVDPGLADHSNEAAARRPDQADRRKPFAAPRMRREERLTRMTAEQGFFGSES